MAAKRRNRMTCIPLPPGPVPGVSAMVRDGDDADAVGFDHVEERVLEGLSKDLATHGSFRDRRGFREPLDECHGAPHLGFEGTRDLPGFPCIASSARDEFLFGGAREIGSKDSSRHERRPVRAFPAFVPSELPRGDAGTPRPTGPPTPSREAPPDSAGVVRPDRPDPSRGEKELPRGDPFSSRPRFYLSLYAAPWTATSRRGTAASAAASTSRSSSSRFAAAASPACAFARPT